jgi:hypothetical protein
MSAAILLGAEEYGAVYDGAQDLLFIDALKLNLKLSASANNSVADVKEFMIDSFVTIAGLRGQPDLYGKYGKVASFDKAKGLYTVEFQIQIDDSCDEVSRPLAIGPDYLQAGPLSKSLTASYEKFDLMRSAWLDERTYKYWLKPAEYRDEAIGNAKKIASVAAGKSFVAKLAAADRR